MVTFRERYLQEVKQREEAFRKEFWKNCLRHTDIPWQVCPPLKVYGLGPQMVFTSVLELYEVLRNCRNIHILYSSLGTPSSLDEADADSSILVSCNRMEGDEELYYAYVPADRVKNYYRC
jgi:hypothetical protein